MGNKKARWTEKGLVRFVADVPPDMAEAFDELLLLTGETERKKGFQKFVTWASHFSRWQEFLKEMKLEYLEKALKEEKKKR